MISFEHVTKSYDALRVLDDLDLRVADNEVVAVVGPSGVGKTTILNLITGLIRPDLGRVIVTERVLGYVFQEPRLLPWRTSLDNVAAPLEAGGSTRRESRLAAARWLTRVGLGDFQHFYPAELSGGMAQRVSIARALAIEPRILLMDEPFSGMDMALKDAVMAILQTIIKERKTTVVCVTHELNDALRLADRIVELGADHRLRELDLSDRGAVAREWLTETLGSLEHSF